MNRKNIYRAGLIMAVALPMACTANYLEINTNPYEVNKDQTLTDGYAVRSALAAIASTVVSTDVNTAQFTDCLLGGPMGGYYATSGAFEKTFDNYNPTDDWSRVFMASDKVIPTLYSNLNDLETITDDPTTLAIAKIMKVAAMHRITDTYGPMPYSQIGADGKLQIPYDSQEKVYDEMNAELDEALAVLSEHKEGISPNADVIYGGSSFAWGKFANSLKLRLAMRIVYASPDSAKVRAEAAVKHEFGVFTSNADNAELPSQAFGDKGNPLYTAIRYNIPAGCQTGGDTHAAADIICYMNGYNDPRREKFFIQSEWEGQPYVGMRRGIVIPPLGTIGRKYSGINISLTSPLLWMNASEVAFLKAEAAAVFGFDMGGDAKTFYEDGIRLSFEEAGVGGVDAYIADTTSKPQTYTDPATTNSYTTKLSEMTIAWDEHASKAEMQEKIIIQKWIANFNLGNEAWADYRRTGYPHLIPATAEGNKSNGEVKSELGARRMRYPDVERSNNLANYQYAVENYLKGPDKMGTKVWWDCNPAIN